MMDRLKTGQLSIADAIDKMFQKYHLSDRVTLSMVRKNWAEITGATISKYTTDLYIRNKVLYVKVSNSTIKQELNYNKSTLLLSINQFFKKQILQDIVIN